MSGFEQFSKYNAETEQPLQQPKTKARGRPRSSSKSPTRHEAPAISEAELLGQEQQKEEQSYQNVPPNAKPKAAASASDSAKSKEAKKKAAVIEQIREYEKEFGQILTAVEWDVKMTLKKLEEVRDDYQNQVSSFHRFKVAKMAFIKGSEYLPIGVAFLGMDLILDGFPQVVAQSYDKVIEPTWKEIVIKYDLFKFGPELRLLMILQALVTQVDAANRKNRNVDAEAPKGSKYEKLEAKN